MKNVSPRKKNIRRIIRYVGMHLTQLFWKMAQYMGIATIMLSQYAVSGCVKCIPH
jgi:hypothetical protein